MADDEIAVTIEDDASGTTEAEGKAAPAEPVADLKAQVAELTEARKRDSDRAANAERAAALARNREQEARTQVETVRKEGVAREAESIDSGIASANESIVAAKKEFKAAGEAGDYAAQADAQERLAAATAKRERLTEQKADVGVRRAEAARPAVRQEAREDAQADPFEAMLADMTQQGAGRSADWIRKNRDTWSDDRKNAKIRAAHFDAVADGIKPESDDYFKFIEERVGLREAEPEAKSARVEVKTHSRRPPVAPVAESGGGMNGSGGTTVKLSKRQADAATDGTHVWGSHDLAAGRIKDKSQIGTPIGHQEMARRVLAQTKEGLYDANNISA